MLGPFRIRNLRRPTTPSNRQSHPSTPRRGSYDAVLSISGMEYDFNALEHPESRLKFLDEDDGEVVTVGTQLELAQRLEDPIRQYTTGDQKYRLVSVNQQTKTAKLEPVINSDLHVFDIDHKGESVRIWNEIAARTREFQSSQDPSDGPGSDDTNSTECLVIAKGPEVQKRPVPLPEDIEFFNKFRNHALLSAGLENVLPYGTSILEDERTRHFQASNPPQISQEKADSERNVRHSTSMRLSDVLNDVEPKVSTKETAPLPESFHDGNLTAEGKRQAMEAGNRLRLRTNPIRHSKSNRELRADNNRWASYGAAPTATIFLDHPSRSRSVRSPPKVATQEPLPTDITEGSLLQAFQAELAKISRPLNSPPQEQEINSQHDASQAEETVKVAEPKADRQQSSLELITSKLILQTADSIISYVTTLNSQLREHVTMQMLADNSLASELMLGDKRESSNAVLQRAITGLEMAVNVATRVMQKEEITDTDTNESKQVPDGVATQAAVKSLTILTTAIGQLSVALLSNDSTSSREQKNAKAREVTGGDGNRSRQRISYSYSPISEQKPAADHETSSGTRSSGTFHVPRFEAKRLHEGGEYNWSDSAKPVNKGKAPTVRFEQTPSSPTENPHKPAQNQEDRSGRPVPPNSFSRHVRSPLPWNASYHLSERQSATETISGGAPYEYVVPNLAHHLPIRHSLNMNEVSQRSRSRSPPPARNEGVPEQRHTPSTCLIQATCPICQGSAPVRPRRPSEAGRDERSFASNSAHASTGRPRTVSFNTLDQSPAKEREPKEDGDSQKPLPSGNAHASSSKSGGISAIAIHNEVEESRLIRNNQRPEDSLTAESQLGSPKEDRENVRKFTGRKAPPLPGKYRDDGDVKASGPSSSLRYTKSTSAIRRVPGALRHEQINPADLGEPSASFSNSKKYSEVPADEYADISAAQVRLTSPPSEPGYDATVSPLLESPHWPTLEQFEGRNGPIAPRFPPLPSMEPLIPSRPNVTVKETKETKPLNEENPRSTSEGAATAVKAVPGPWTNRTGGSETFESSGDFFRRMTGLTGHGEVSRSPPPPHRPVSRSPVRLGPAAPGARLVRPFDPTIVTAEVYRRQNADSGLRRSATVSGLNDRYTGSNRRPYSTYFDGNGRVGWDSFLREPQQSSTPAARLPLPHPAWLNSRQTARRGASARATTVHHTGTSNSETMGPAHNDPRTIGAVQLCVEQLKHFGFGKQEDGGMGRLAVYAQAANGNLEEAMDLIEEERKAYLERRARV